MIITLKISLDTYWSCEIEFEDNSTLVDVHHAIQNAVDFDDDHFFEFFVARNRWARNRVEYSFDLGNLNNTMITDVFPLQPKQQLFYLFDYGASWIFKISKSRKAPRAAVDGVEYPRVVKETGQKPLQYGPVEDEDDFDDEDDLED